MTTSNPTSGFKIKTHLMILAGLLVALGSIFAILYYFFPQTLLSGMYRLYEHRAGVTAKQVEVDGYKIDYYEGGTGTPLVLIHGFGDSMVSFVQSAGKLTKHYRVILPQVPGFGKSLRDPKRNHSIRSQALIMNKFLRKIGLKKFHLGGNSMGGHISVSYTLMFPRDVHSLLLLNAAGMKTSDTIPYEPSKAPLQTEAEFDKYIEGNFVKKPFVPRPFKMYFIEQSKKNFAWDNRIRREIREGKDYILNNRLGEIRVPTLAFWGDKDTTVHPRNGRAYHRGIAGSKWVLWKDSGHSPQYENPEGTADVLLEFLKSVKIDAPR